MIQYKNVDKAKDFAAKGAFELLSYKGAIYFINDRFIVEFESEPRSEVLNCRYYVRESGLSISIRHITGGGEIIKDGIEEYKRFQARFQKSAESRLVNSRIAIKFIYYLYLSKEHYYSLLEKGDERILKWGKEIAVSKQGFLEALWTKKELNAYVRIGISEDQEIMGADYPLIFKLSRKNEYREEEMALIEGRLNTPLPKDFQMNYFLSRSGAKDVDFYSSSLLSNQGIFVSKKAKELLQNYSIHEGIFHSVVLNKSYPQQREIEFLEVSDATQLIDFEQSIYTIEMNDGSVQNQVFQSYEDYLTSYKNLQLSNEAYKLKAKKIVLKKYPDLWKHPHKRDIIISHSLAKSIIANKLLGVEIYNIDFYVY